MQYKSKDENGKKGAILPISGKKTQQGKEKLTIDSFSVPAQDSKGHSARVGLRVVPDVKRRVAELVQSGQFPWKTDSDFWRWAGMWGMEYAAQVIDDKALLNSIKQMRLVMDAMVKRERLLQWENDFAELEQTFNQLMKEEDGGEEDAREMLMDALVAIEGMEDDKWRRRWQRMFDRKFGKFLKKGGE